MLKITLDTNCIIAAETPNRGDHQAALALIEVAKAGRVDVAFVASSASERQEGDYYNQSFKVFQDRVSALGFGDLCILQPLHRLDVGFWDEAVWASQELFAREEAIYRTLFPQSPYEWAYYAALKGVDPAEMLSKAYMRWRNQIIDAQAYWAHENAARDIFVTSDQHFKKLEKNSAFPSARICKPDEALAAAQEAT